MTPPSRVIHQIVALQNTPLANVGLNRVGSTFHTVGTQLPVVTQATLVILQFAVHPPPEPRHDHV